jgi:FAD synthetase
VTDSGYPPMLRINPILYWEYAQVWEFIKTFNIPYCELYNKGFTYLGNNSNTVANKQL